MKFSDDKKKIIITYILEKIAAGETALSKVVSENFDVNQNTIHAYINELLDEGIIVRKKRGIYELVKKTFDYELSRKKGHLDSDTYAFDKFFVQHLDGMPTNVVRIWNYVFSEMINNVMDHSLAETATIHIEQDYLTTTVILHDYGIGIFEKIKNHYGFESLDEAITELFKGKLTTDKENHSGEGIFFSSKMMDEYYIVSSGKVFRASKYNDSEVIDLMNYEIKGTYVIMKLSNFSNKNVKDIFDLYSNEVGEFNKTLIPLKNIFETAPVSRSQAKRVCNRLEKFNEAVIDFEGLDWMGQGFAHQLFVVFANANPTIKLVPINMNEDVSKMYNHVINAK